MNADGDWESGMANGETFEAGKKAAAPDEAIILHTLSLLGLHLARVVNPERAVALQLQGSLVQPMKYLRKPWLLQ